MASRSRTKTTRATTGPGADGASLLTADRAAAFFRAARRAGCPADQVENFLRAGIVLQSKQCLASSLARRCDVRCGRCERAVARGKDPRKDCPDCGPTELAYGGARGGGKSHWMLAQMVDDCLRSPGLRTLMLRKVGSAGKENFENLLPKLLPGIAYKYIPSSNVLLIPTGGDVSRIRLGNFQNEKDVEKYLGIEYDVIGVEEATTLSLSKYKVIQASNRTSKPGWRPRIYSTTNPGGIGHDWYKRRFIDPFRAGAETTTRFVPATVEDNAFVNAEYRGILNSFTGWLLRAWRYGDWDIAAGQYFTTFNRAFHSCPAFGATPRHWRYWMSLDYGFRHYTAVYLLGEYDGEALVIDEHAERRTMPADHAAAMDRMVARHGLVKGDIEATVAGGDCWKTESDGTNVADAYEEAGWPLTRADMRRVDGAFELLKRLGDPGHATAPKPATIRISEACRGLLSCIPSMVHSERNPEDVAKVDTDDDGVGGDDWYDSCRYGLMYVAGGPRVIEGETPMSGYRG